MPSTTVIPKTSLADFIAANIEPILEAWEEFAQDLVSARPAARDHARSMLMAIAADIRHGQTPAQQAEKSLAHVAVRMASGFSINEEVTEYRALRVSVLRLWNAANSVPTPAVNDELMRLHEAIDQILAESFERYLNDLQQHSRLLDMLMSSSPDLHCMLDLDGNVIYANQALTNLYGTTPSEILGKNFLSLEPAGADEFQQHLTQVIQSKNILRCEMPCLHSADKSVRYEYLFVPVLNAQGEVVAVACTVRNMTERTQLESESKREKLISDTIIESTPGAFFLIDQQANLVRWNTDLKNHTGLSDDQLRGSPILATLHEDDRALAAAKLMTAFATGYAHMDVRVLTRPRGLRHYQLSVRRLLIGDVPYVAGFGIDVTDRKRSEAALDLEKKFSDTLIESVPGAFYVIDAAGNYIRWNNYLNKLTGLSNRELRERPLLLSIQEEDRPLAAATLKKAFEHSYAQAELHVITREQGIRPFSMTARRFQVGDNTYLVGVGNDTSEWQDKIKHLEHEARTDPLTQVATRGHFMELARQEFARSRRYGHPLSLWMLDIDHFKTVNDTYGHLMGDLALQSLVATSQQALRHWDILGRVGGEEFAVLLPETETSQALVVAERLRQTVASARVPLDEGKSVGLTVSIGIATAQENDTDIQALFQRADQALYEAKRTGRNKVCLAESTHS